MPIINTNTGKVIVTDEELLKKAKEWIASYSHEEFSKMIKDEIKSLEVQNETK